MKLKIKCPEYRIENISLSQLLILENLEQSISRMNSNIFIWKYITQINPTLFVNRLTQLQEINPDIKNIIINNVRDGKMSNPLYEYSSTVKNFIESLFLNFKNFKRKFLVTLCEEPPGGYNIENPIFNDRTTSILLNWLVTRYINGNLYLEDIGFQSKATEYFVNFFKYNSKFKDKSKDINSYENLAEIYLAYKPYKDSELLATRKDPKSIPNAEFIYEDDRWLIMSPKTEAAACELGKDTEWCTSKYKPGDERNQFIDYNSDGPLYIFYDKQNQGKRYQIHTVSGQSMDEDDKSIPRELSGDLHSILFDILTVPINFKSKFLHLKYPDKTFTFENLFRGIFLEKNLNKEAQYSLYQEFEKKCNEKQNSILHTRNKKIDPTILAKSVYEEDFYDF